MVTPVARTHELAVRSRAWYQANAHRYDRLHPGLTGDADVYAALARERVVLEIGAGTGRVSRALAETARRVVAVDVAPAMLSVAARRLDGLPAVHLIAADGRALPLRGPFDLIALPYRVVHHVDGRGRVALWRELRRVAASDAWLAFDWWDGPMMRSSGRGGQPPTGAIDEGDLVRGLFATGWVVEQERRGFRSGEPAESRTRVWVARAVGGAVRPPRSDGAR